MAHAQDRSARGPSKLVWLALALLLTMLGIAWLVWHVAKAGPRTVESIVLTEAQEPAATSVTGPIALTMNSTAFEYRNRWQVDPSGADPYEPADPWHEPSGRLHFSYQGSALALLLAVGNYWGYLYVTVDGEPANLLPHLPHNRTSTGQEAGYRTLYAPELSPTGAPVPQWVPVHRASDSTAQHDVTVELWRSWGQKPLRGVAVDMPVPQPPILWPGVALLLLGGWLVVLSGAGQLLMRRRSPLPLAWRKRLSYWLLPPWAPTAALVGALVGVGAVAVAVTLDWWPVTLVGLFCLAWAGVQRPALWIAALLLGLPFYFTFSLPLLPGRAIGLIDMGILGGTVIVLLHWLLQRWQGTQQRARANEHVAEPSLSRLQRANVVILAAIVCWALLATVQAAEQAVAWREWRTIFLYGGLFGFTLMVNGMSNRSDATKERDQTLLVGAWLAGSTVVALVALWQYGSGTLLIQAEGVERVRAFYGSPNNLALYLERALAVTFAFAFFVREHVRWLYIFAGIAQAMALILTFSKGALLFGLPAIFAVLWLGGWIFLRRTNQAQRPLWWLAATAAAIAIVLLPFLGTERFQRLLDFEQGTGFVRLQLWQSSWRMALDHPWLGVGPDNFLYAYRSLYLLPAAWQEPNLNHPHNWLLDWWTRLGLPGLALALSWFGTMVLRQWQQIWYNKSAILAIGLLAATAAALAHGLIDASYALPDLFLVWVLISYLPITEGSDSGSVEQ